MAEWDEDYEEYTLLIASDFGTHNYELLETYSTANNRYDIELREDGTIELREGLP